jgi:four helix bundle protein
MAQNFRELTVYKKAYHLAMYIFELTKKFPREEKYALTDQVRRSSRSVCRAIGEGYRKRQYPNHFVNKMSDADMENTETQISIDFAFSCGYITKEENIEVRSRSEEVGKMLNHMIENPERYRRKGGNDKKK